MGIFKSAAGSLGGTLADQWLEFYVSDAFPQDVLAARGVRKTGERSANKKGDENVITDGSTIVVHEGQCALVIEKGNIIAVYTTPGENTFRCKETGSVFSGGGLRSIARQSFDRFGYGGIAAIHQYVMYLDLRERMNNPFDLTATVNIKDRNTGMSFDARLSLGGMFSFRITDPAAFYKNICSNSTGTVYVSYILPQITAELKDELRKAAAKVCAEGVSPVDISENIDDFKAAVSQKLTENWSALRGFGVSSLAIDSLGLYKGDLDMLQEVQKDKALTDPTLAAAHITGATGQAMQDAAKNPSGGAGFVGVAAVNAAQNTNSVGNKPWICVCGFENTGKFCEECGKPKA